MEAPNLHGSTCIVQLTDATVMAWGDQHSTSHAPHPPFIPRTGTALPRPQARGTLSDDLCFSHLPTEIQPRRALRRAVSVGRLVKHAGLTNQPDTVRAIVGRKGAVKRRIEDCASRDSHGRQTRSVHSDFDRASNRMVKARTLTPAARPCSPVALPSFADLERGDTVAFAND